LKEMEIKSIGLSEKLSDGIDKVLMSVWSLLECCIITAFYRGIKERW
jgi:hypothetical protein